MASPFISYPDAHGWNVSGNIYNVAGNMVLGPQRLTGGYLCRQVLNAVKISLGLELLRSKASPNAHYDGEHLAGPTKCDPDTRVAIIDDIISFIQKPATSKPILWLNGAADTGKSAIALSVAAKCEELGLLAATFMFWNSDPSRNSLEHFVPTIAERIATAVHTIGAEVDRILTQDPLILKKPVETQWVRLVIDAVRTHPHPRQAVIIIDGLDECKDHTPGAVNSYQRLLNLVWSASCTPGFPFLFLITSRPEPAIVSIFTSTKFQPLVQSLITLGDTPESKEEIRTVTTRNLRECGVQYSHIVPPEHAHDLLTTGWFARRVASGFLLSPFSRTSTRQEEIHTRDLPVFAVHPRFKPLPWLPSTTSTLRLLFPHLQQEMTWPRKYCFFTGYHFDATPKPSL